MRRRGWARPTPCSGRAHRRLERGTDVVVGFVRAPRPARTPAGMLDGPRGGARAACSSYRGTALRARWTSTPSSPDDPRSRWSTSWPTPTCRARRHDKRWQDVEELLAAGIDVITTVNIQHLESLNDVVGADHRRPAARDRARRGGPARRPDRAGRHDPGGAAPPDGPRQRLRARRRSTRRWPTTSGSATSPPCASSRCCGSPTGSTTRSRTTAGHHGIDGTWPTQRADRRRADRRARRARRCSVAAPGWPQRAAGRELLAVHVIAADGLPQRRQRTAWPRCSALVATSAGPSTPCRRRRPDRACSTSPAGANATHDHRLGLAPQPAGGVLVAGTTGTGSPRWPAASTCTWSPTTRSPGTGRLPRRTRR